MSMVAAYGRRMLARKAAALAVCAALVGGPAAAAPLKLLTFGDSLTAGYGLSRAGGFEAQLQAGLQKAGFDVVIIDGGVSGDTSAGGASRIDWMLGESPDAAIVELGGNDGLRALPVDQLERNLTVVLDRLAAAHVPTLLSGMYPPPNYGTAYSASFHAVYERLSKRPGLLYDPFFLQDVALHPALIQADGIHPNAAGVRIIVARLLPLVETLLRGLKAR